MRASIATSLATGALVGWILSGVVSAPLKPLPRFELQHVAPAPTTPAKVQADALARIFGLHPATAPAPPPARCPSTLHVSAALVSSVATLSSALVHAGNDARVASVGDSVLGWRVREIERAPLRLSVESADGTRCDIDAGMAPSQSLDAGSAESLRVERTRLEHALDDPATLRSARVMPAFEGGRCIGFKLFALRPDSPLATLGFRNDDVIRRVGGIDLESPDAVLGAWARLRGATRIDVELDRAGARVTRSFELD